MSAEMKNNQSVAFCAISKLKLRWKPLKGRKKYFADAGDDRRQGMALANQASALEALKRHKEAMDYSLPGRGGP